MSVLIKGMEMPTTGGFITLQICGDGTVCVVNKATGGVYIAPTFEEANGTDERIRASSLPTPHGRLIDADSLIAKHEKAVYSKGGASYSFHMAARAWVMEAPVIIEAESEE